MRGRAGAVIAMAGAVIVAFGLVALWATWDVSGSFDTPSDWSHRVSELQTPVLVLTMGLVAIALGLILRAMTVVEDAA